jgi:hypothetical protein
MPEEQGRGLQVQGVGTRQITVILLLAFVVALAVMVGNKMSAEAMAVVIGVVCGVAAGIPTALLMLVVVIRRDRQRQEEVSERGTRAGYPPVIVIQGGAPQTLPLGQQTGYWQAPIQAPPSQRQFHVVGGEDLLLDDGDVPDIQMRRAS